MKPSLLLSFLAGLVVVVSASAADALQEALQRGLLAEEARHDLKAAADAYAEVVRLADGQRAVVATAVFRLAETRRRLGQTNEATAGYQRLIREFPEQTNLVAIASLRVPQEARKKATAAEVAILAAEVDRLEAHLFDLQRRLEQTGPLLASLKSKSGRELRSILSLVRPTPLLQTLLQDLAAIEIRRSGLNPDLGPQHPDVRRFAVVTENLDQKIDEVVQGIMAGLELQVTIDRKNSGEVAKDLEKHRQELLSVADPVVRNPGPVNADRLANQQADTAQRLLREEPLLAALRAKGGAELVQALAVNRPTPMLERLLSDRSTADQQRAALDVDLGPEHPDVKRSRRVLEKLGEQIDAEAKAMLDALESSIAEQKTSLAAIERQRAEARKQAATVRDDPERLLLDEIAVAEEQLATARKKAEAGAGPQEDVLKAQREVLALRRQLAAAPGLQIVGVASTSGRLEQEKSVSNVVSDPFQEVDRLAAELAALEQISDVTERARALQVRYPQHTSRTITSMLHGWDSSPNSPDKDKRIAEFRRDLEPRVLAVMNLLKERLRFLTLEAEDLRKRQAARAQPRQVVLYGSGGLSGTFPLVDGQKLMLSDVIIQAGGKSGNEYANLKKVKVRRRSPDGPETVIEVDVANVIKLGDRKADVELQDGDRIEVPARSITF